MTPYCNTIPLARQPHYPGDEALEAKLAAAIRWNAMVMVMRANRDGGEQGGHIASYASAADLFEVGFQHFFRGKGKDRTEFFNQELSEHASRLFEIQNQLKHALKNAFLPVLSYLGPATAYAMTGSFVIEKVFSIPGRGQHFVNGVLNKDLFLIMGVVLIFATMLVLFNLAVDVLYRWVDPRIS